MKDLKKNNHHAVPSREDDKRWEDFPEQYGDAVAAFDDQGGKFLTYGVVNMSGLEARSFCGTIQIKETATDQDN